MQTLANDIRSVVSSLFFHNLFHSFSCRCSDEQRHAHALVDHVVGAVAVDGAGLFAGAAATGQQDTQRGANKRAGNSYLFFPRTNHLKQILRTQT